jgi:hypothetical protein
LATSSFVLVTFDSKWYLKICKSYFKNAKLIHSEALTSTPCCFAFKMLISKFLKMIG